MALHEDYIPIFIPKRKTQLIILGTMGSINARIVNHVKPEKEFFYYNNSRNHFWKVLQYLFQPDQEAQKLSIKQKKAFLDRWGIAMVNIVQEAKVNEGEIDDPSDTVLFEAYKRGELKVKRITPDFKSLLQTKPIFFTCRHKKGIHNLLKDFFEKNHINLMLLERVWYWPSPTRCNPQSRSLIWKKEMDEHIYKIK